MDLEEIILVLGVAGFTAQTPAYYRRDIDAGRYVTASINEGHDGLVTVAFALTPTIGGHGAQEHHVAAYPAAVMFRTAQALAERGDGPPRPNAAHVKAHPKFFLPLRENSTRKA